MSTDDAKSLQDDLNNFETCSTDAGLYLNGSASKTLRVTRKHQKIDYPYCLKDCKLENSEHERDLGVWFPTL